jgi:hypothetical protein
MSSYSPPTEITSIALYTVYDNISYSTQILILLLEHDEVATSNIYEISGYHSGDDED